MYSQIVVDDFISFISMFLTKLACRKRALHMQDARFVAILIIRDYNIYRLGVECERVDDCW